MSPKATLVGMLFAVLSLGALPARPADLVTVVCESKAGERQHCPADTSSGVVLARVTGAASCLLGKSWGYDDQGIWVLDGCGGEFKVAAAPPASVPAPVPAPTPAPAPAPAAPKTPAEHLETWGTWDPGQGFLVGKTRAGELSISGYALLRYINQNDSNGVFTDHLGTVRPVDTRQDIGSHRVIVWFKGWMGDPRLVYAITLWTVNATDQKAIFGNIGYQFSKKFSLYGGVNGNPGSRSLQGSHPYWLGHDRVMADEFFRPYFGVGVWANGELAGPLVHRHAREQQQRPGGHRLGSRPQAADPGSVHVVDADDARVRPPRGLRRLGTHDKLATRFGFSSTHSPEQRFPDANGKPKNTTLRLADSLNVFDTGSLAPGVTVSEAHLNEVAIDAGMKYKGVFLQAEYFTRRLYDFTADGPLPVKDIVDTGFYIQAAFYPLPKKLELYAATSQIYGDKDAGFNDSWEYLAGLNFYPFDTRNHRLNLQVMDVHNSPVSSSFGYYVGGQNGYTISTAFSIFF